jgi:hypothetical protein
MAKRTLEERQAELTRKQISLSLLKATSHLNAATVSDAAKNDAHAITVLEKAIADIRAIPKPASAAAGKS